MAKRLLPRNNRTCSVEGCENCGEIKRGFCNLHYRRWRRHGDPLGGGPHRDRTKWITKISSNICSVDSCSGSVKAHGYCSAHYERWKKYGTPLGGGPFRKPAKEQVKRLCSVEGCEKTSTTRGLCPAHYQRWRRHGDPLLGKALTRQNIGGKQIDALGYVFWTDRTHPLSTRNGRVYEHRAVMSEIVGRYLNKTESVHHINGNRTDNRPENLELWVSPQPAGQRPADLVAWAKEILELYPDSLLAALDSTGKRTA